MSWLFSESPAALCRGQDEDDKDSEQDEGGEVPVRTHFRIASSPEIAEARLVSGVCNQLVMQLWQLAATPSLSSIG